MDTRLAAAPLSPSAAGIALAFLGMFVVGSLGVQLLTTATPSLERKASVTPVVAHPSTLWKDLGER